MIFNNLFNPFKKLDAKLDTKEINQIAIFKANRLVVQDLLVLDHEKKKETKKETRRN